MKKKIARLSAVLLSTALLINSVPISAQAASNNTDSVYLKQDGTPAEGLLEAVENKDYWLFDSQNLKTQISETENSLIMSNGAISREFALPQKGGTNFYTKSYENTYIEKELMTGESHPEVYLGLYNKPYRDVYEGETIKVEPEYYYIGGSQDPEHTFVYQGYEIKDMDKPFEWAPHEIYGDPAAEDWPPPGKHVEFTFTGPVGSAYEDMSVKVIYEMYDNCAAMKKRVEITNTGDSLVMVGRLAPEVLHGNEDMKELLYTETTYTCGAEGTIPIDNPSPCNCAEEKENSPFWSIRLLSHSCYDLGPAYEINKGESFVSFDTYEIVHSTYWFEQQSQERLSVYRKLFPWITDNPLTMHNTGALTKEVINHAAEAGFELIIQSFSAPDQSNQMLTRNQQTLDWYKQMIEYAHSKNIDIGIYQAQYTRNQYKQSPQYGSNNIGQWGTWCFASAAFDDYWDNFKYFIKYTGVDCVEIDGTYPGCACGNGEKHVNQDKETDPDPAGTDKTTGDASKYAVHQGYYDSKVKQWENAVRLMCKEFRDLGVYIQVPAWYYLNGGNKCGIGYEEIAWSQPRHEQFLYARQLMHNASYVRTMSMSWSHIPFKEYHGGGESATYLPFADHLFDYNWILAENIGNGVTGVFRGPSIYDTESLPVLQRWVNFYNRYRGIANSNIVHIAQAAYAENDPSRDKTVRLDTLYHVNANNEGEKGLLWVYNQSDERRTETITVPMYYTGLTTLDYPSYPVPDSMGKDVHKYGKWPPNYKWLPEIRDYEFPAPVPGDYGSAAFVREGVDAKVLSIDSNGNAMLEVTLEPMSFTYFAIYKPGEEPKVEVTVDQVTGLKAEETAAEGVKITWDANTKFTVTENGEPVEHPAQSITGYKIYRDGQEIGQTMSNSFTDTDVMELEEYTYTVSAMVGAALGTQSDGLKITVAADQTAPTLLASKVENVETIVLTFSEAMDKAAAETLSNYHLDGGNVIGAVLSQDGKTVTLTVEPLELLRSYALQIQNLTDASSSKHPLGEITRTIVYGYLAYYPMDGVQNGVLAGEHGTPDASVSGVTFTSGTGKDGCIYFNAKDKDNGNLGFGLLKGLDTYSLSFSFWPNNLNSDNLQSLLSAGQENMTTTDFGVYLQTGKVYFRTCNLDEANAVELVSADDLLENTWNQVTITRSNDTFTLYLNGRRQAEVTRPDIGTYDFTNAIRLGAMKNHAGGDTTAFYDGRMDDLVLTAVCLSDHAVAERWQEYLTYCQAKPIIKLDFEDIDNGKVTNEVDKKTFNIIGTPEKAESPNKTMAMKLSGDDYINLGNEYQLDGEFTVTAWVNIATTGDNRNHKIFSRDWTTHKEGSFYACVRNSGYNIEFANPQKDGGGSLLDFTNVNYIPTNTWVHFSITCDGTTVKAYKNGVLHEKTGSARNLNMAGNDKELLVGAGWNSTGTAPFEQFYFIGAMDDVRMYDMALTQEEIVSIYEGKENQSIAVQGVQLNQNTLNLQPGESMKLVAGVIPANATNQNVTWTTSDDKVATVENGKVTAVAEGTATITVTTEDGGKTAACTVTVKKAEPEKIPVTGVTLDKDTAELKVGETLTLTATVAPANATNKNVTWTTSDDKVATVENGKVTAVAKGEATITVTTEDGGHKAICKVTVEEKDDGGSTGGGSTVTRYTITVKQTEGGKISPATCRVDRGSDKTFTIKANDGYTISDVLVDGKSVGAVSSYTFENVRASHTITAEFTKDIDDGDKPLGDLPFTDVKANDWFAEAVKYVVENKLMNGVAADKFAPNSDTTRAMIVTILYREAGSPKVESDGKTWWSDARVWAMEQKISDGTNMEGTITREQLAAMLYRYVGSPAVSGTITGFSDTNSVSSWANDAMLWAVQNGIISGSGSKLDPQGDANRAEVATMLMRFCEAFTN